MENIMIMKKTVQVLCVSILVLNLFFVSSPLCAQEKTKVLIITERVDHFINPERKQDAADPRHMYEDGAKLLKKCLEQTPGVEVNISNSWPMGEKQMKQDLDTIALYGDASPKILLVDHEEEVTGLLNSGVGLVAIHWSTGYQPLGPIAREDTRWKDQIVPWLTLLGGMDGIGGNYVCTSTVEKIGTHPIQNGIEPFEFREEYFMNPAVLSFATPIFKAKLDMGGQKLDNIVAWAYERVRGKQVTKGRSVGIILGHFHANWGIEDFRQLVVNSILWSAHREVPTQGAPVEITPKDLELPDYWR
jgi:type 1 glutamine amidotransferase